MGREEPTSPGGGGPSVGPLAERVLDGFYQAQQLRHHRERERLQRSGVQRPSAKWNRQELYLDRTRCERARAASRQYLARHPEWVRGKRRLSSVALREAVALQHYLDVDLEDLSLPATARRSEDAYGGVDGNICEQMLLDAARSTYVVDGEEFDFAVEMAGHGATLEMNPAEVERLQLAFSERLVECVLRCLGEEAPAALVRAVSTAMSQSGLANLERACDAPQVAVCGGEHQVKYELRGLHGGGAWELRLSVRKAGFEQCIVYDVPAEKAAQPQQDPLPLACHAASYICKSCRLRFAMGPEGRVEAETLELRKEMLLRDSRGRQLAASAGRRRPAWPLARVLAGLALRLCGSCAAGCGACCLRACRAAGPPRRKLPGPRAAAALAPGPAGP